MSDAGGDNNQQQENVASVTPPPQPQEPKCHFVREQELCRGKWLKLSTVTYTDPSGKERQWEAMSRTTTSSTGVDAVSVLAVLSRTLKYDCMICVRQYRPPVRAYTIEFPAGLIDEGETPETAAVRELKEETGYSATVKHRSPPTAMDPGTSGSTMIMVTAEIDGDSAENKHPKPRLEEGEFVEVIHVPVSDLLSRLDEYASHGDLIDSRVYNYAIALTQATKERELEPAAQK